MTKKADSSGRGRWIILLVTVVSTFMATLDSSIVNVALPSIAASMQVDTGQVAWVVSSYLIVITVCILIFGRLGDLKGQGKVFRYGLLIFTVGSFLCGLTHTLPLLVAARIVQAVGAAASMANNQGIITRAFPPGERGRALGINGTFVALGSLAGPSLGGLILSFTSWEYLFWLNVPIGLLAFFMNLKYSGQESAVLHEKMDMGGGLLFAFAVAPLLIALEQGQALGYSNPLILISFAVALLAAVSFFLTERKKKMPMLDLHIFKNKWYSISIFCALSSFIAMSCSTIVMPFYFQSVLGMTPGEAGLYMTIAPLILSLLSPASGYLSDKIGSEVLTLIGLILTSLGLFLMSTLNEMPAYWVFCLFIVIMSLGNGLFQSPNTSLVMSMLPREKLGIGGSVNALVRNLGFSLGTALSTAILYGGMSIKLGTHVTGYVTGQNSAFIFGMHLSYITAASICMVGALITAFRLYASRKKT